MNAVDAERAVETVLAIVRREVGPVSPYARIDIERAVFAAIDDAEHIARAWYWEDAEPETTEDADADT